MEARQFLQSCREILPMRRPLSRRPHRAAGPRGIPPALPGIDPALQRVLVILGPAPPDGRGSGVAEAYIAGARSAGAEVRELRLDELSFLGSGPDRETRLEEERRLLFWCQHLVLVHPEGWAGLPANLSALLDRCLLPGFAYVHEEGRVLPLLGGRTAEVITASGSRARRRRWTRWAPEGRGPAHFDFSGIETVRVTRLPPAGPLTAGGEPAEWIAVAGELGRRVRRGARSTAQDLVRSTTSWLDASRPPLHVLAVLAYVVGTLGAVTGGGVRPLPFLAGVVIVLGVMAAAAFVNELCDYESDARNRNWSAFSGGSRVLVDGRLNRSDLRFAAGLTLSVSGLAAVALLQTSTGSTMALGIVVPALVLVALGYSLPPLRFSHRAFGEVGFALALGVSLVLLGYLGQGGSWTGAFPWMMGVLIGISAIPAIILAQLPDRTADRAAGKLTLVVRLGPWRTVGLALAALLLACLLAASSTAWTGLAGVTGGLAYVAVPHAILVAIGLVRYLDIGAPEERLDGLLAGALLFPTWFMVVPLIHLY